jgi:hypothetical protein
VAGILKIKRFPITPDYVGYPLFGFTDNVVGVGRGGREDAEIVAADARMLSGEPVLEAEPGPGRVDVDNVALLVNNGDLLFE